MKALEKKNESLKEGTTERKRLQELNTKLSSDLKERDAVYEKLVEDNDTLLCKHKEATEGKKLNLMIC